MLDDLSKDIKLDSLVSAILSVLQRQGSCPVFIEFGVEMRVEH